MPRNQVEILVNADTRRAEAELGQFGKRANGMMKGIVAGMGVALGGAALGGAVKNIVSTFAAFEESMARVRALSGANEQQFKALTDIAREMGRTTRFTAQESADALSFLAMAGFNAQKSIAALPGVLDLAAASGVDLATSADIASNVLTGFQLRAEELGRVNDVLTKTFTSTNTDMLQLSQGMKFAGPVAASLGLELEEVAAILGQMGNAGIQGTMAGRALRMAMLRLVNPTTEVQQVLNRLNVATTDSQGEMRSMIDILADLAGANLSAKDAAKLWGTESVSAMSAVMDQGVPALQALNEELENSKGITQEIVDIQTDTLANSYRELTAAIDEMKISAAESRGELKKTLDFSAAFLSAFSARPSEEEFFNEPLMERLRLTLEWNKALFQGTDAINEYANNLRENKKFLNEQDAIVTQLTEAYNNTTGATTDATDAIKQQTVEGQDWITRFGGPFSDFAYELAEAQTEAFHRTNAQTEAMKKLAKEQEIYNDAIDRAAALMDTFNDRQDSAAALMWEFRQQQDQLRKEADVLAVSISSIAEGLEDEEFWGKLVANVYDQMADGTKTNAQALRAFEIILDQIIDSLGSTAGEARAVSNEFANMEARAIAAGQAMDAALGRSSGRGAMDVPLQEHEVRQAAAGLLPNLSSNRLSELGIAANPVQGITLLDALTAFLMARAQALVNSGVHRGDALIRAIQQIEGFSSGGVVPGPPGKPRLVMAHGGEEFLGVNGNRGGGGSIVIDMSGSTFNGMDDIEFQMRRIANDVFRQGRSRR